jgi:Fe-S-cluster-containing dehydrogenase component
LVLRQVHLLLEFDLLREISLIFLEPTRCQGCRLCEAACSFHQTGHKEFNPALTSTRISRDNDSARITMSVDSTCDSCRGEESPLCVKYCAYGARGFRT